MKAETLKKSILQYAMQGKLVAQDPNDEPASKLLKRIKAEKEQLIKDGKIKKEKPLPPITEDEIPFKLPFGWTYERLGTILEIARGGSPRPIQDYLTNSSDGLNWIKIGDSDKGGKYINSTKEKIIKDGLNKTRFVKKGDFLLSNSMSFGRPYILDIDGCIHDGWLVLSNVEKCFNKDFLYYLLSSYYVFQQFCGKVSGAVVKNLNTDKVSSAVVCIPPLAEQQRIVKKLEEILLLVEEYGKNEEILSEMNKKLPKQIRQSILQYAVQGKLVPQNPNDEPASELLKRIKDEKEQLIKEGKIKKEKPLPPITADETPYELPQGWEWTRLRDLTEIITKGSSPSWQGVNYTNNKEVLFITSENVGNFKLLLNKIKYVEYRFNEIEPRSILEYNDILMNIVGASIGRTAMFDLKDTLANINQATCIIRIVKKFKTDALLKYLLLFFNSPICYMYMNKDQVDSARANLSMTNIANFLIPLPPLAEQQCIVAKVEELLAIVESLKR